ncbi:hypothetical protein CEN48_08850 [Fischerella thermalis CCMEE 5282]|uniref:Type II secretion system protein GspC N-terminal domain-containing protein n=1 Tax=Fischerella thermalis JSC-11 TaxID=741277 RepID=G6FTL4_9CYAN|nr:hypothetical protein [Fischerella thermalis]EHC13947.1 hypothetical protein FJSC11DRAFT_2211 [Fischerella thermalis JSC-11]PMB14786.1 hypothetical protein CEN48_08850 [Fischerella thermalis CCMEE 5282]
MGINLKILIAAISVLVIAACASEGEQQSSNPTPPPPNTPAQTQKAPAQAFNNPVVPGKSTLATSATASLIQPTNAKERIDIVSKGRNDPFAQIIGQSSLGVPSTTAGMRPVPKLLPLPINNTRGRGTLITTRTPQKSSLVLGAKLSKSKNNINKGISNKNLPKLTPVLPRVMPQVVPEQGLASVLPPQPQPDLAKAVFVSGVVMIGNQPQAIIKVPNEPTSRYVQAGQRLANGVLIKRIEMNEGSEPIIILEQYGIEVTRMVGEAPASSPPTATTANTGNPVSAVSPVPNPVNIGSS